MAITDRELPLPPSPDLSNKIEQVQTGTGTGGNSSEVVSTSIWTLIIIFRNKGRAAEFLSLLTWTGGRTEDDLITDARTPVADRNPPVVENADSEYLEAVHREVGRALSDWSSVFLSWSMSVSEEVFDSRSVHLLFQVWRRRVGYRSARTLIVTGQAMLLCVEDLSVLPVRIKVVDWVYLKDVMEVQRQDEGGEGMRSHEYQYLTFVLKGAEKGSYSFTRKWRLLLESYESLQKLCFAVSYKAP